MLPQFFGQFLLEKGIIDEDELRTALEYQQRRVVRIGDLAVQKGLLTREQAEQINIEQRRTDKFFGELAISLGFLTKEQVDKLITIQKNNHIFLGDALVELRFLTKEELEKYLYEFHQSQKPIETLEKTVPEKLSNRDELITVLDVTTKLFRRLAHRYLKIGGYQFVSEDIEINFLFTLVDFKGSMNFTYFLDFPKELAFSITKELYGQFQMEYDREVVSDCIREFTNIICGNINSQLLELGQDVKISMPASVFKDDKESVSLPESSVAIVFPAMVPSFSFHIGIIVNKSEFSVEEIEKKKISVLIVDDSALSRAQLADMISSFPETTTVGFATDGETALRLFSEIKPSVVLLDLVLPDIPGEEVAKKMLEINSDAKIVVLSGLGGSPRTILESLQVGAVSILQKPIEQLILFDVIKRATSKKKDE